MVDLAVRASNLHKRFGDIHAVKGVSFDVNQGEIYSLLGPNGAGKSTIISMLSCLLRPDEGDAQVMGHSVREDPSGVKRAIGVVPQEIALYEDLTARENMDFWGRMYGLRGHLLEERVREVLDLIELADRQSGRVGKFSGGMKRRVNIGVALLHRPAVIIMDEPTVGIDPQSRRHILDGVKAFNEAGMTVLYTTHYMEEAQELSDHIAIMDQGEIIAFGTHEELVHIVGEKDRIEVQLSESPPALIDAWREMPAVDSVQAHDGTVTLLVADSDRLLPELFATSAGLGVRITSVDIQEPNLETVFLHLTGKALRD